MKKKILVTGSTGFIGKIFLEFAKNKYKIVAPSHNKIDLTNIQAVDKFFQHNTNFDVLLHLANIGGKRNDAGLENIVSTNLMIFLNLLKNKKHFKKMIYMGSGAEYDKSFLIRKVKEEEHGKRIPNDAYGFYKYICSLITQSQENVYCLRLFGVFGKYEDYEVRFISNIILKYLFKLPLTITQNAYFDYLDVYDLVRIIDYFIWHKPKHKFYNIGRGRKMSLLNIAKKINKLNDYSMPIKIKKKGLNKEYSCDNSRLIKEIGDFKFTSFNQSLRNLHHWYETELSKINKKSIIDDEFN